MDFLPHGHPHLATVVMLVPREDPPLRKGPWMMQGFSAVHHLSPALLAMGWKETGRSSKNAISVLTTQTRILMSKAVGDVHLNQPYH